MNKNFKEKLTFLLNFTKKLGSLSVLVTGTENTSLNVTARLGKLENVERNESTNIGLRVIDKKRQTLYYLSTLLTRSSFHDKFRKR